MGDSARGHERLIRSTLLPAYPFTTGRTVSASWARYRSARPTCPWKAGAGLPRGAAALSAIRPTPGSGPPRCASAVSWRPPGMADVPFSPGPRAPDVTLGTGSQGDGVAASLDEDSVRQALLEDLPLHEGRRRSCELGADTHPTGLPAG